jgi:carboxypeptidase C (cathepsin A)
MDQKFNIPEYTIIHPYCRFPMSFLNDWLLLKIEYQDFLKDVEMVDFDNDYIYLNLSEKVSLPSFFEAIKANKKFYDTLTDWTEDISIDYNNIDKSYWKKLFKEIKEVFVIGFTNIRINERIKWLKERRYRYRTLEPKTLVERHDLDIANFLKNTMLRLF